MELGETTVSSARRWPSPSDLLRPARSARRPTFLLSAVRRAAVAAGLLVLAPLLFAPKVLAQTATDSWRTGEFAAAYESASAVDSSEMQLLAARAASDHAVYVLAEAGEDLGGQLEWLRRALAAAERAVELDPASPQALVQLARARGEIARRSGIMQNLNVAGELKRYFDAALELDPQDADALAGLAMWHLELVQNGVGWLYGGQRGQVLPLLEAAVAAAPEQINLRVEYATALRALEAPELAEEQLRVALALEAVTAVDRAEQERARRLLAAP